METSGTAQAGFVITTLISYGILSYWLRESLVWIPVDDGVRHRIFNRTILALIGWALLISGLSLVGFFSNFDLFPPRLMLVLVVPLVACLFLTFSSQLRQLLVVVPPERLVYLQSFRVVVEILLWSLYKGGKIPVQMTFEGRNLDVLSGLSAPIVAYLLSKGIVGARIVIVWNIVCLGLLANIVITAILSMPTPFRVFMNEPANTVVAEFPYIWLPGLLVPLAYGLHFFSLRQLSIMRRQRAVSPK